MSSPSDPRDLRNFFFRIFDTCDTWIQVLLGLWSKTSYSRAQEAGSKVRDTWIPFALPWLSAGSLKKNFRIFSGRCWLSNAFFLFCVFFCFCFFISTLFFFSFIVFTLFFVFIFFCLKKQKQKEQKKRKNTAQHFQKKAQRKCTEFPQCTFCGI